MSKKTPVIKKRTRTKRAKEHYVNNKKFSQAVFEYATVARPIVERNKKKKEQYKADLKKGQDVQKPVYEQTPIVPDYIAICFMKIAEGLATTPSFSGYPFREDLVFAAVENCLKAVSNYNIEAATRTGTPNAFAYFTRISYHAFQRKIMQEYEQTNIKRKIAKEGNLGMFMGMSSINIDNTDYYAIVDDVRNKLEKFEEKTTEEDL